MTNLQNELGKTDGRLDELRRLYDLALTQLNERDDQRERIRHLEDHVRQLRESVSQVQDRGRQIRLRNRRLLEQNSTLRAVKHVLEAGCDWRAITIEALRFKFAASTLRSRYMYSAPGSLDHNTVENRRLRKERFEIFRDFLAQADLTPGQLVAFDTILKRASNDEGYMSVADTIVEDVIFGHTVMGPPAIPPTTVARAQTLSVNAPVSTPLATSFPPHRVNADTRPRSLEQC